MPVDLLASSVVLLLLRLVVVLRRLLLLAPSWSDHDGRRLLCTYWHPVVICFLSAFVIVDLLVLLDSFLLLYVDV